MWPLAACEKMGISISGFLRADNDVEDKILNNLKEVCYV